MTVINTNVGALTARTYAVKANDAMQDAMERLSSGLRINSAADDAAGLAVANKMESQLRGMNVAIRNSQDGISLVQTAESGMAEISNMVVRMRELAVQMNNGVYTTADRQNAQLEVTALLAEIDKIASNTAFNDVKVLDGTYVKDIRAGNTNAESISVAIDAMNTAAMGGAVVTTGVKAINSATANAKNASSVDVTVSVAGTSEAFTLAAAQLSTEIQAKTGGYFTIEAISSKTSDATIANMFQVVSTGANAGDVSSKSANPLQPGQTYSFNVVYKDSNDATVYTDRVNITANDYVPSGSTSTTVAVSVQEGQQISFNPVDATNGMSDRFKEFVAANAGGTYSLAASGNDNSKFTIADASTGVVSAASNGTFDFENPTDVGDTSGNNTYVFDLSYVDTRGVTFSETVTMTVTNDTTTDAAVVGAADSATTLTGKSKLTMGSDTDASPVGIQTFNVKTTTTLLSAAAQAYRADEIAASNTITYTVGGAAVTGGQVALNSDGFTVEVDDNIAAGTYTFDVTMNTNGTAANFVETISIVVTDRDTGTSSDLGATQSTNISATGGSTFSTSATTVFGSNTTTGGEPLTIDLAAMLTGGDTNNGFKELKDFATANGTTGVFTFGTGTNSGAASGVAIPTGTNGTAGTTTDAGKLILAQAGDYGTTGKNAMSVTYVAGGETFTQTVELDWTVTGGVTQATDKAAGSPNTVGSRVTPALVGTSTKEVIGGKSTLSVVEARKATISSAGSNAVLSPELKTFVGNNPNGTYSLTGTDADSFSINAKTGEIESIINMDYEKKSSFDFNVVYSKGAKAYTENIVLSITNDETDDVAHVADIDMSTAAGAAAAVTVLDVALNTISSAQAKLGAIQNRLQHNIDNLSMASMLTETARGRIVDADFARETSELSKQQILGQAATSMLAQANQSKQSVLALLQ